MFRKVKQKVFEISKLRTWGEDADRFPEKQMVKPICATIAPVLHIYFEGLDKVFLTFVVYMMNFISNALCSTASIMIFQEIILAWKDSI